MHGDIRSMKIIVTSGATREHIDEVRFISSGATGMLGSIVASRAAERGFSVVYIHGVGAALPSPADGITRVEIVSARDLEKAMRKELADPDVRAVVHPMAVSDFTPARRKNGKISSRIPGGLTLTLVPTPKIVRIVKELRPDVFLVSFKLETGITREELLARARESLRETGSDAVVANLLEETRPPSSHRAFIVRRGESVTEVTGKEPLARHILSLVAESAT